MASEEELQCPYPSPARPIFRELSNFKTPKQRLPPWKHPDLQTPGTRFFTASKQTPRVSSSSSLAPPSSRSKTARRRLKALEIEQSQSARKVLVEKERSLKSLAKSMAVWLNFLFESPSSCGCDPLVAGRSGDRDGRASNGKREGFPAIGVRVDAAWRSPKRLRGSEWHGGDVERAAGFPSSKYLGLKSSLKDVCSFEDLKRRMQVYLSLGGCKEVFDVMTQVVKNIDDGRMKMKAHCPIVTDVGLKDKAIKIIMCYKPVWLRIGLYIVFGGDSLLCDGSDSSDHEMAFLRMIIEKQFFSHTGLAKGYAYNKMVEGLYRPGYYEALGNIILKRFLLLVLFLDRAKTHSSLSLKHGIDGVDGGSPLLFTVQSSIKSSRQVILEFLSSDTMLGVGNLIAHLTMIGYKVSYQQNPLVEFDFKVSDLFSDLQDGVRLCRVAHLLMDDSSILMKLTVPSDTSKRHLSNCSVVLQYLRQAGVPLHDDDGMMIVEDDIVNGDKELTISLLWNIFVHLQLPRLMKKTVLVEEIHNIIGADMNNYDTSTSTPLELLLCWIKAICQNYGCRIDSFSSMFDGKAIWCLLDYYFRKELPCSSPSKDSCISSGEESIVLATDYSNSAHNFLLSQKLATLLGNFPEVLQISEILEYGGPCNERSVVILLAFLSSQLVVKKNMDQLNFHKLLGCHCQIPFRRNPTHIEPCFQSFEEVGTHDNGSEDAARKFKIIQAWWQEMTERNYQHVTKPAAPTGHQLFTNEIGIDIQREIAAKTIQFRFRQATSRRSYQKMRKAASLLQTVIRAWLIATKKPSIITFSASHTQDSLCERWNQSETWKRHGMYIIERNSYVKLKKSALLIQKAVRNWITWRHRSCSIATRDPSEVALISASVVIQKHFRGWSARSRYNHEVYQVENVEKGIYDQNIAAIKIQSHLRCWLLRKRFQSQKEAIMKIQNSFRMSRCIRTCQRTFQNQKQAVLTIQRCFRMSRYLRTCRGTFINQKQAVLTIQRYVRMSRCLKACQRTLQNQKKAVLTIQRYYRMLRCLRFFHRQKLAVLTIQRCFRMSRYLRTCQRTFEFQKQAILTIQRYFRMSRCLRNCQKTFQNQKQAVLTIQSTFRMLKYVKSYQHHITLIKAAMDLQSFIRQWICHREACRRRHSITVIQRHLRGWLARRDFFFQREAALKIQKAFRMVKCRAMHENQKQTALDIKCFVRGEMTWGNLIGTSRLLAELPILRSSKERNVSHEMKLVVLSVLKLQRWWRNMSLKQRTKSATTIQSHIRGLIARRNANRQSLFASTPHDYHLRSPKRCNSSFEMKYAVFSVLKLQRWWRRKSLELKTNSALKIQSCVRGWITRRKVYHQRHQIVVIQSYWKGYLARKGSREQLLDLRLRMERTAANVDDGMRIINRLIAAVSELLSKKSVSGILHTVATLDMATRYSEKCCEELVKARAIDTLLELIRSISRSVPDQEVLKHTLSTLRNLARYPHLVEVLIDCRGSVETILLQLLRNKDEVYFITSQLMKMICSSRKGIETVRKSPAIMKRLHGLVEELTRKAQTEKRLARGSNARENTDRRLKEAVSLLKMVT